MMRSYAMVFLGLLALSFAPALWGQDDDGPVVMAMVLQNAEAGAEAAKVDEWVASDLKMLRVEATTIQKPWFQLTDQAVTIHDTKLYGTFTMRLVGSLQAEMLTVLLDGGQQQRISLPRKNGTTKVAKHELTNHLGDKLPFYVALRVEKAGPDGPAPLEIGADADGKTISVSGVFRVIIRLPGNATTGYGWAVGKVEGEAVQPDGAVQYLSAVAKPGEVGTGGNFDAYFRVVAKGQATVTMEYKRPWEKDKPAEKTFTVTLDVQKTLE